MKGRDRVRKKYLLAPFCLGAMVSFAFAKPATVHADNEFDLNVESNDSLFSLKNSFNFSYNNQKAVSANKEEALLKKNQAEEAVLEKKNADAEALKKADNIKKINNFQKDAQKKLDDLKQRQAADLEKATSEHDEKVAELKKEIEELDKDASDYQDRLAELNEKIEQADKDLQDFKQKQEDDYAKLAQELADQQKQLEQRLAEELQDLINQNKQKLAELIAKNKAALDKLKADDQKLLQDLAAKYRDMYRQAQLNLKRYLINHPANAPKQLLYQHENKTLTTKIGNSIVTWPKPGENKNPVFSRKSAGRNSGEPDKQHEIAPKQAVTVKKKSENKQGDFPLGEAFGMILAAVCAVIGTTFVWRFKSGGDVE